MRNHVSTAHARTTGPARLPACPLAPHLRVECEWGNPRLLSYQTVLLPLPRLSPVPVPKPVSPLRQFLQPEAPKVLPRGRQSRLTRQAILLSPSAPRIGCNTR